MVNQQKNYTVKRGKSTLFDSSHEMPVFSRLDIELTERCNNNCIHCYINLPENDIKTKKRELSTEQWKDILRQAAELGYLSIRFTGGEPLLREDFSELYTFTRHLGLKVLLSTNARLITPELADLFSRIIPGEKIGVTVYGMHPGTYEAVSRDRGSFLEFQSGIRLLIEREIPFHVRGIILPMNRRDVEELETYARTIPWMNTRLSYALFLELRTRRDSPAKNKIIRKLRLSPEEVVGFFATDEERYRKEMADFCTHFMKVPGDRLFSCGAGNSGVIDAYGMYQPCMFVRHPDLTIDLKKESLRDAILTVRSKIGGLHATNPDYLFRCARCFLHGLCEQCPGKSWGESGTLDTPVEYHCEVAHARARFLGLLDEGEHAWEVENGTKRITRLVQNDADALEQG